MKRTIVALLTMSVALAFSTMAFAADKNVGVMWVGKSGRADRTTQGFLKQMNQAAPGINVEIKKDLPDEAMATALFNKWQNDKDAIVFLRSSGAKFLGNNSPKVPCFVGGCTTPVSLGAVPSLEKPGGMISGTTYFLPHEGVLSKFLEVFPKAKTVGLIYEEGHPGSVVDREGTKEACAKLGLTYKEAGGSDDMTLLKGAKQLAGEVDFLIIGNQALAFGNAKTISSLAGSTPVLSYSEKPVMSGDALCGFAADDDKLGVLLADSVIDVVENGKDVGDVPVKTDPEPQFLVSPTYMKKANVDVPQSVMGQATVVE